METIRNTLAALTAVTEEGHDVAGAIAIGLLCLICLLVWAASEGLLRRDLRDLHEEWRKEDERDAIAETIGLIDRRRAAPFMGEFADEIEQRLAERGDAS